MSRSRPDLHGQTEFFKPPNETACEVDFGAPFEVVRAEFLVRRLLFQDVVRSGHDGGRDGENRFLGTAATFEAEKLRPEVGISCAGRHPRDLDECGFEPGIAGACPRGKTLPGAFMLARTEPR